MENKLISEAKKKREDSYALIKKEYKKLIAIKGSQKIAVITYLSKVLKVSVPTIYKALNYKE